MKLTIPTVERKSAASHADVVLQVSNAQSSAADRVISAAFRLSPVRLLSPPARSLATGKHSAFACYGQTLWHYVVWMDLSNSKYIFVMQTQNWHAGPQKPGEHWQDTNIFQSLSNGQSFGYRPWGNPGPGLRRLDFDAFWTPHSCSERHDRAQFLIGYCSASWQVRSAPANPKEMKCWFKNLDDFFCKI